MLMNNKLLTIILTLCLALPSLGLYAQNKYEPVVGNDKNGNNIYAEAPDRMPEFKGGVDGLGIYLSQNTVYPKKALKVHAEGKAVVEFIINEKGKVVNPTIKTSAGHEALDAEAIRVIRKMPRWKPGTKDGKPVKVKYYIPVNFALH